MARERGRGSRHSQQSHHYHYVKPFGEKLKDCCRSTIAFVFSNVGVCGLMVGYTIMGAFLFCWIEGPKEGEEKSQVESCRSNELRNETIERLWKITVELNVLDETNWRSNVSSIMQGYQKAWVEMVGSGNCTPDKWDFEGGFLYSLTVITTIGYGHISPHTQAGKVMTIIYTIFGMPVFLLYMANMGDILAKSLKWTYAKLCICRRPPPRSYDSSVAWRSEATLRAPAGPSHPPYQGPDRGAYPPELGEEISIDTASWSGEQQEKAEAGSVNIPITVSLVIMVALLYGGTLLFGEYEEWDALTAFYFCFISLTTIGFGDYVPGLSTAGGADQTKSTSFIYCSIYLMFGLALLSMCFNLMQEEVVHKVTACLNAIRFCKRRDTE